MLTGLAVNAFRHIDMQTHINYVVGGGTGNFYCYNKGESAGFLNFSPSFNNVKHWMKKCIIQFYTAAASCKLNGVLIFLFGFMEEVAKSLNISWLSIIICHHHPKRRHMAWIHSLATSTELTERICF